MEITEVRIKLVGEQEDKLKAFCSITLDDAFVIRDLKIIEGAKGLFVAMPSRKLTVRCGRCSAKNQMRSNFCSECGATMGSDRGGRGKDGRPKLHADIAHPINSECRELIQTRVLESYGEELVAASQPDYEPKSLEDYGEFELPSPVSTRAAALQTATTAAPQPRVSVSAERSEMDESPPDDNFGAGVF